MDTLVAIHEAVGLGERGRPAGYTSRQVERWREQLEWTFEVTVEECEVPELDRVGDWLAEHCPDDHPHAIVHSDYKLDNVMFSPANKPEIAAVFDWEMATLGDPHADLEWMLSYWRDPKDPEPDIPELVTWFMEREAYLTRVELVERWKDGTGLMFKHERFYRALAVYKARRTRGNVLPALPHGECRRPDVPREGRRVPGWPRAPRASSTARSRCSPTPNVN